MSSPRYGPYGKRQSFPMLITAALGLIACIPAAARDIEHELIYATTNLPPHVLEYVERQQQQQQAPYETNIENNHSSSTYSDINNNQKRNNIN
eukprot:UN10713